MSDHGPAAGDSNRGRSRAGQSEFRSVFILAKLLLNLSRCFIVLYSLALNFHFSRLCLLNTGPTRMSLDNDARLKFGVFKSSNEVDVITKQDKI